MSEPTGITLREYQSECVAAVEEAIARGVRKQLAVLPTGGGKTIVFSEIARRRSHKPTLILAHRDELLTQAREKLVTVAPELAMSTGLVKAGSNDVGAPIVIASIQTLARESRLTQLPPEFGTIIVDEAHHIVADSYQRVIDYLDAELVLGVTATAERSDGKELERHFDELVFARSIEWMVEQGYLCPPRGKRISVDVDLSKVKKSHGDFQAEALADALEDADAIDDILAAYTEHGEERKTLIFCPTVAMAHHTAAVFCAAGLAAEALDGTTPAEERAAILRRLHTGETQIVANVGVLTEGFDEPSIACIVLAAPTKSRVKYTQIVGRGLRTYPGKTDCLILDVVGVSEDNSIQSLPALFGLSSLLDGEDVMEAKTREAREKAEEEALDAAAEEAARSKDQRKAQEAFDRRKRNAESIAFFNRERMNWTTIDERWTIPLNRTETIIIWPTAGEHFDVLLANPSKVVEVDGVKHKGSFKFLARGLDLGYAQGAAEETIRRHGNRILADAQAAWRGDKVTPGQRGYLQRLGEKVPGTKGEAADLISQFEVGDLIERIEAALIEREASSHDFELEPVA